MRRVTCFVGKLWFKSGASKRKNYLQTPTAVCGLRGSNADVGYNPAELQSLLNIYAGEAAVVGTFMQGFFNDPGISAAKKSEVFNQLKAAVAAGFRDARRLDQDNAWLPFRNNENFLKLKQQVAAEGGQN